MKAIVQVYRTGVLSVVESPPPQLRTGWVLVCNAHSVISAGTEKTKVDTARKSLLGKAMARPDLVKKLLAKARREGLWKAWQTASDRLDEPASLGYSCAGQIIEASGDVDGLCRGDWVACGGSTANHAEIVCVPKNLAVQIPEGVSTDHAAFATIGAIAMQGVRQADVRLGERVAVIGLGLVGLLTVQLLKASGCRVLGIDVDPAKLVLGRELGCEVALLASDECLEESALIFTDGYGVDATIITAGTSSNQPIEQAGEMTREKGRVVVVGATGLTIPREPFYHKEIDLRISRSYGPGRYDTDYEEHGHDYPFGYVRFTERRNMACFLDLVQKGQVDLSKIITHRFGLDDAPRAYELLSGARKEPYLGIVLEYSREESEIPGRIDLAAGSKSEKAMASSPHPSPPVEEREKTERSSFGPRPGLDTQHSTLSSTNRNRKITVGVIGAGNYAKSYLIPSLRDHPLLQLGTLCTGSGISAAQVAGRFGFQAADADVEAILEQSDAVVIATRHGDHADYVVRALAAGKPVFVEKPLAITEEQLEQVIAANVAQASRLRVQRASSPGVSALHGGETPPELAGGTPALPGESQKFTDGNGERSLPPERNGHGEGALRSLDPRHSSLLLPSITVGFNRRFAPATVLVRDHFASVKGPKQILIRVNAGSLPADHWINDAHVGGGRLIGEGCHFVDLAVALTGAPIATVQAFGISRSDQQHALWENFSIQLTMSDGSMATIVYTAIGDSGLAKERIEMSGGGRSAVLDDFVNVDLWHNGKSKRKGWSRQDKGQRAEINQWAEGLKGGQSPIPFEQIVNVHRACLGAVRSLRDKAPISV